MIDNEERGMIKWLPFASVVNPNELVNNIMKEKNKISKPILSEDELKEIENSILTSFECKNTIEIYYYKNGYIYKEEGIIKQIDIQKKLILLSNNIKITFNTIIKTNIN